MPIKEILLDVSELAPPEPFEKATSVLLKLQPSEYLRMLHRRQPFPLYDYCEKLNLAYQVLEGDQTEFEIFIWNQSNTALTQAMALKRKHAKLISLKLA